MSEATMSRDDEIRARVEELRSLGGENEWAGHKNDAACIFASVDDIQYLLAEVERLARQRDVLAMEIVRTRSREDVQNWERRYQSGDRSDYAVRMHRLFDALSGEGGGA